MVIPRLSDEDSRHEWLRPPRKGLLTSEFASVMDVTAGAIRAAIRRGRLPGVQLRVHGKVFAYAAEVDAVADYYELPADVVAYLQRCTERPVPNRFSMIGTSLTDQTGGLEIQTEFETRQEFNDANSDEAPSV